MPRLEPSQHANSSQRHGFEKDRSFLRTGGGHGNHHRHDLRPLLSIRSVKGAALIGDIFPIQERQAAIGIFMGISFLGQGLSMVTGGAIAYLINWRGVFAVYAIFSVIPGIMLMK